MSNSDNNNKQNPKDDPDHASSQRIPYRRDRTPSIVVQSLGLSFQKDSNITGSIELLGDDEDSSPNNSETSDPKSSTSGGGLDDTQNAQTCDSSGGSAKGSSSSLQNSSSPGLSSSPIRGVTGGGVGGVGAGRPSGLPNLDPTNRRLSLNIGSVVPRRQSLTVDGISSASFISPAYKDSSSGNATGSLRNKVALKPGHSLMGWIKLASTAQNLSGTNGRVIEVTPDELAKHDKEEDCWVALKGNVYNVTTYLHYHPGGIEELMRGAGRDATELFNEVHRWVNYESILAKCLVGPYKLDSPSGRDSFKTITNSTSPPVDNKTPATGRAAAPPVINRRDPTVAHKPPRRQSIALTVPSPNKYQSLLLSNNSNTNLNQIHQPPTYVIMQDKNCIKLKIQDLNTLACIRSRHLIGDLNDKLELHVSVILSNDWLYRVHLRLDQPIDEKLTADLSNEDGTITVLLNKKESLIWNRIGTSLGLNDSLCETTLADKFFRPCRLLSKQQLTHDTYLFEFRLDKCLMYVPIGWHVLIRAHFASSTSSLSANNNENNQEDQGIHKNYTPVLPTLFDTDGLTDESGFMNRLYFIIKIYSDGVLTSHLNQLKVGDNVDISDYQCVDFDIENLIKGPIKHWILFAAGTGVTPFCRIISYLLSQDDDRGIETVTLNFFNKTQKDIIWRDQFDKLAVKYETRFRVNHILSNEPTDISSNWMGKRGKMDKKFMSELVDSKSPDELQMLVCGPRVFCQLTESFASELNLHERLYRFHG